MTTTGSATEPIRIAVYICTYKRNEKLRRLLDSFHTAALHAGARCQVGIVVVDDNVDGRAKQVVADFPHDFELGLHYRHTGSGNISIARNTGLEACLEIADWAGMVDDDEVVVPGWFDAFFDVQQRTGCDAVTGPVYIRYPEDAPQWLSDQPFAEIGAPPVHDDGEQVPVCSTGNSIIRASFLRDNPAIRFREDLGTIGGEDMVFYMTAMAAGMDARHSTHGIAYGVEGPERATWKYQLRSSFWMGNTEYVTNIEAGRATPFRLFLRGAKRLVGIAARPFARLSQGERPQFRYAVAMSARAIGLMLGPLGVRVAHH